MTTPLAVSRITLRVACIAALTLAASAPVRAQDDDPTRDLQNLVYYPHAGQAVLTPEFTGSLQDSGQTNNIAGAQTQSRDAYYDWASLGLSYGVFDGLRLSVSETYLFDRNTKTTTLATDHQTSAESNGFSDPTFAASYRYAQSLSQGLFADITASFTPAFGSAQSPVATQTGDDINAAWTATITAPFYLMRGINELELAPSLTRNFGGSSDGTTPGNSTQTSSYWSGAVLLQDRIHVSDVVFIQPGVTLTLPYAYDTANELAGTSSTSHDVSLYATPALTLGWLVKPWFLLEGILSYTSTDNSAAPPSGLNTDAPNTQTAASLLARIQF